MSELLFDNDSGTADAGRTPVILGTRSAVWTPLPRLGLDAQVVGAADLPGSGQWVSKPHTVVAFGLFYFGLLAASKLGGWRLPGKPVVMRNG